MTVLLLGLSISNWLLFFLFYIDDKDSASGAGLIIFTVVFILMLILSLVSGELMSVGLFENVVMKGERGMTDHS